MGSSNVSEDGASERVRFDNIVYYSMDEAIEKVCKNKIPFRVVQLLTTFKKKTK